MISVDLKKYPEHAEAIQRHAVEWLHGGQTARMESSAWEAIRKGENPQPQTQVGPGLLPPATDAEADPKNEKPGERGCCDPPLE